jgi:hypothetical protein
MATSLNPEEQVMGSFGASGVEPSSRFDLVGALQDGYTPAQIADELARRKGFNITGARQDGYRDDQIISHLMGETAFTGSMQRLINAGGSSIKGIADLMGGLNKERALAERTAADIASANAPKAGLAGEFAGAIADPVTLPAFALKGLKAATLVGTMAKQGAAQGALGGFLEPVLTEEESRLMNTVKGTAVGTVFGAGIGKASQGVINFLEKRAIKAADADTTKAAIDDVAKAIDVPPSREAQPVTATQAPVDYTVPAYMRKAEAQGVPVPEFKADPVQIKLVEDRIAKTEAEIAKHEADLAKVQQQQPEKDVADLIGLKEPTKVPTEKQVAALFKAPEGENLPAKFGLVAPTPEAPAKQVAALFKNAAPSEVPVIKQQIVEAAKQGTAQQYLIRQIETKKAEVERLKGMVAPAPREFPIQVETKVRTTPPEQLAPRVQQAPATPAPAPIVQAAPQPTRIQEPQPPVATQPVRTQEPAPAVQQTSLPLLPTAPAEPSLRVTLQGRLPEMGGNLLGHLPISALTDPRYIKKAMDVLGASTEEQFTKMSIPLLQQRGNVLSESEVRQIFGAPAAPSRGFQSGGAAATPRELVFAESVPFNTNAEKLLTGGQTRGATVSANEEWNSLFAKAIGVLGAKGRQLRGRGEFGGSLEGTMKAGEKAAARMQREEGSIEDWVFKQDEKGNFPNIDKSWNRAEVEAFRPVYEEARATLSANLAEINRLRDAGELTESALNTLTYRSQLPIGILGIFQGQRTKASDTLNAFKLAKSEFDAGKEVKGLFQPGVDCQ